MSEEKTATAAVETGVKTDDLNEREKFLVKKHEEFVHMVVDFFKSNGINPLEGIALLSATAEKAQELVVKSISESVNVALLDMQTGKATTIFGQTPPPEVVAEAFARAKAEDELEQRTQGVKAGRC